MPSFFIPLSGLEAGNTALNTIANNLANMNTVAYKSQNAQFSDLFYQLIGVSGSGNPQQVGAGTQIGAIATNFSPGTPNPTAGAPEDVALTGDGFFVINNNGVQEYTRAGNFTVAANGQLLTQSGQQVMGYPVVNGVVDTNAPLIALQIPKGQVEAPQATSNMSLTANLDAQAAAGTSVQGQITLYDSLGESHLATVNFTKVAAPANNWTYTISLPNGDATASSANATGTLTFDANGNLTAPATNINNIQFTGMADGANDMSFNWNLYDANGNGLIDQFATKSSVASTLQDGFTSGQYTGFSVDSNGVISATFSNNQTQAVGQLAVASVTNEQGLQHLGDGNYQTTLASGQATVGIAGTNGRGAIQDQALEGSNVDVSTEFANLIVAQRAFEANAKSVTTFDTVTQDTINMIH
jgi:flagellar hook protein FlgE